MTKHWVFVACAALTIVFLSACGGSHNKSGVLGGNKNSSSSSGSTPAASGTSAPSTSSATSTGPAGDVQNALGNLVKAKSFKGKLNVDGGQFKGDGSIEVVTPDKFHLTFNGGGGLGNLELISIGNTTYSKTGNTWSKNTGGAGTIGIDPTSLTKQVTDVSKTAQTTKGGTDKVNGKSCQIYTMDDAQSKSKTDVCIANDLPVKLVVSGGGSTVTLTFSDFDSNIDIKAPV
jgi:hypothetical protein